MDEQNNRRTDEQTNRTTAVRRGMTLIISDKLWEFIHIMSGRMKLSKKDLVVRYIQRGIYEEAEFKRILRDLEKPYIQLVNEYNLEYITEGMNG